MKTLTNIYISCMFTPPLILTILNGSKLGLFYALVNNWGTGTGTGTDTYPRNPCKLLVGTRLCC